MKLYQHMSTAAQAAFAGVDNAARQLDLQRSIADLPGGFTKKDVSNKVYWYYQLKQPAGGVQQIYVGPDNAVTRKLIEDHGSKLKQSEHSAMKKLVKSAIVLGCQEIPLNHARVIDRLLAYGFFNAGGILIGTHAFLAYQNLFGVRWGAAAYTLDLDFAHAGRNVSIALNNGFKLDGRKAIDSLEMGFVPVQSNTTFKKPDEPDFDLDFVTCRGRDGDTPAYIEGLNLTLQPLKYMELSLEAPTRMTLLGRNGPMVVNLPQPAKYPLHKLIISGERPQEQRTKANKDLLQAAVMLDYLLDNDQEELCETFRATEARGPKWQKRLHAGLKEMEKDPLVQESKVLLTERIQDALSQFDSTEEEDDGDDRPK